MKTRARSSLCSSPWREWWRAPWRKLEGHEPLVTYEDVPLQIMSEKPIFGFLRLKPSSLSG